MAPKSISRGETDRTGRRYASAGMDCSVIGSAVCAIIFAGCNPPIYAAAIKQTKKRIRFITALKFAPLAFSRAPEEREIITIPWDSLAQRCQERNHHAPKKLDSSRLPGYFPALPTMPQASRYGATHQDFKATHVRPPRFGRDRPGTGFEKDRGE